TAVDVPIALLGYGNVGGAVARLLAESADDIERATGHRLRIVRALVRDPARERKHVPDDGILTTDFASIRDDPSIALVAESGCGGTEGITQDHVRAARELEMTVRLGGSATLVDGKLDVRVQPSLVDRHHPLAAVDGPFNAVMLQGDAIREITLEGPGAGGTETASAVVADMISVIGTTGTGFLQNDACWRELERLPSGELRSPFYFRVEVA